METTDNIANITCERLNAEQKQCQVVFKTKTV